MNRIGKAWFWMLDYLYAARIHARATLCRTDPDRYREGVRQPILLLPGIWETWQFMNPVAELLHGRGHPVHVVTGLGRNRATVADAAGIVSDHLTAHSLHDVIIVAHSKGGLIGKYLMMAEGDPHRIDRMVAVASPFSGSSLARYTVLPSLRAFLPSDPTIRLLAADLAANARITSIFGVFDPHIPSGSALPGAGNIRLDVAGHFRILADPGLLEAVAEACGD